MFKYIGQGSVAVLGDAKLGPTCDFKDEEAANKAGYDPAVLIASGTYAHVEDVPEDNQDGEGS